MSWFADLAGKAENLLNNLDEQTGAAIRNHNTKKSKGDLYSTENTWNPKKKPIKSSKKGSITETRSNCSHSRTPSPPYHVPRSFIKEDAKAGLKRKSSPIKKSVPYHLHNCPKTLVDDDQGDTELLDHYGLRQRRSSLPPDLHSNKDGWTIQMQNLKVENAMLKNELNVMNKEVSDLLEKLRKTEDGNNVVSKDLNSTQVKLNVTEVENHKIKFDKEVLLSQMEQVKVKINEMTTREENQYMELEKLNSEIMLLKHKNKDLNDKLEEVLTKNHDAESIRLKLENDLRHAQTEVGSLQNELTKSNAECQRLEKDWATYKHRVKNMLHAKDNEIKCLQEGMNLTEDSKMLMEQLDALKEERDELAEIVSTVKSDYNTMKQCVTQVESRYTNAERVITALREALKDERATRTRAENQSVAIAKELKTIQIETGQTIASLRTALRDKENVLNHYRETSSSVKTNDTSALNVADYDVTQDSVDSDRVRYLSDILVTRQGKIDKLLADNNMLKIQVDKLEAKYKGGVIHQPVVPNQHSVVNFNTDCRQRRAASDSGISTISHRMASVVKRYPAFRLFLVIYMIILHFWVFTVLSTNAPENYIPRTKRSA